MKVGIEDEDIKDLIINVIGDSITKNKAQHLIESLRKKK